MIVNILILLISSSITPLVWAAAKGPTEPLFARFATTTNDQYNAFLAAFEKSSLLKASKMDGFKPSDVGLDKGKLAGKLEGASTANPQLEFNRLALTFEVLNNIDMEALVQIKRLCNEGGLLAALNAMAAGKEMSDKEKYCEYYPSALIKSIEARITSFTSYILMSEAVLAIPDGWTGHVSRIVGQLQDSSMLPDALKYTSVLLSHVAKGSEKVTLEGVVNALRSKIKTVSSPANPSVSNPLNSENSSVSNPSNSVNPLNPSNSVNSVNSQTHPTQTKITIDARNLNKDKSPMDDFVAQALGNMMTI